LFGPSLVASVLWPLLTSRNSLLLRSLSNSVYSFPLARPPRVRTQSFPPIYPPHLHKLVPCSYWTSTCCGALSPICALYAVPVRQARGLPPSSFRFRVATDTLGLSYALPATGRARDFHPLDCAHTGRTQKSAKTTIVGFSTFL